MITNLICSIPSRLAAIRRQQTARLGADEHTVGAQFYWRCTHCLLRRPSGRRGDDAAQCLEFYSLSNRRGNTGTPFNIKLRITFLFYQCM